MRAFRILNSEDEQDCAYISPSCFFASLIFSGAIFCMTGPQEGDLSVKQILSIQMWS